MIGSYSIGHGGLTNAGARVMLVAAENQSMEREADDLLRGGFQPVFVNNAEAARGLADQVDLALVDLTSEMTDPLNLIGHMWCVEPELPIIIMTESFQRDLRNAALKAGCAAAVNRPYDEAELLFAVRTGLDQRLGGLGHFLRSVTRTMASIAATISNADDRDGMLKPVLDQLLELFEADRGSIMLFDDETKPDEMHIVASNGIPDDVVHRVIARRGDGVAGRVAQSGISQLLLRSLQSYQAFCDLESNRGLVASMAVPIREPAVGRRGMGAVQGVLNIARQTEGAIFTPRDLEICEFVAGEIAQGLSRLDYSERQTTLQNQMQAVEKLTYAGEIAAGIAHEVANPIGYTRSNLKALEEYVDDLLPVLSALRLVAAGEESKTSLDSIEMDDFLIEAIDDLPAVVSECRAGIERAVEIVQKTKSMVRIDQGADTMCPVFLAPLVKDTLRLLQARVSDTVRLDVNVDPKAAISGMEVQLSQVLVNLVTNAADACDERHQNDPSHAPCVSVSVSVVDEVCVLRVADNGVGIPEDLQRRIFEPLFTTKPKGVGTGLGLGIIRRIVESHNGHIQLESAANVGTSFTLTFPRLAAGAASLGVA